MKTYHLRFFYFWLPLNFFAWAFGFMILRLPGVSDLAQVPSQALDISWAGGCISFFLALGIALYARPYQRLSITWLLWSGVFGALAFFLSYLFQITLLIRQIKSMGMQVPDGSGNTFFMPSSGLLLLLAGLLLSVAQWPGLRPIFGHSLKQQLLWCLGLMAAWGGGWLFSGPFAGSKIALLLVMGLVSGSLIFVVLEILRRDHSNSSMKHENRDPQMEISNT